MIALTLPHGADPMVVLLTATVGGVSAIAAGAVCTTRETDYLLSVPETHASAVAALVANPPTAAPERVVELTTNEKIAILEKRNAALEAALIEKAIVTKVEVDDLFRTAVGIAV